jgi:hypothetical protein
VPYVIQLVETALGLPTRHDGQWVVEYDPSPRNLPLGEAVLRTSANREHAKRFKTRDDAWYLWRRVDTRQPVRADGKPNRPLTAWTVSITQVEE